MKKRKSLIIKGILIGGIILLISLIIGIIVLVNSTMFKEFLMKRDIRKLANEFYSYYYDEHNYDNNIKNYLKKYEKSGIDVKLKDIQIIIEENTSSGTIYSSLEKCDIEKTRVIIFPKKPYTKNDKELKFELSCK